MNNFIEEALKGETQNLRELTVNGKHYRLLIEPHWTLAYVLRDKLGFTGLKVACDNGACGACTVLINGETFLSCMTLAVECKDKIITTIEGLADGTELHPIQEAWLEEHGTQCGFCAPGAIMTAKAFLDRNPDPTKEAVREALAGNICRCGNYDHVVASVLSAALKVRKGSHG